MSATLSVSIIAKNEENNLKRCIGSIKNIADEIILVDTGSTDNTISLAKSLGAKVYSHSWNNDFSEAKNAALEKCTMDWVLVIDCDEELDPSQVLKLKELTEKSDCEGFYLRLINLIGDIIINETSSLRLFKNRKEYRFKSKLHEQIFFSINEYNKEGKLLVTDIILKHYGYDHNVVDMEMKTRRNIKVLEGFEKKDKDAFFYFSLGNEYSKLNDLENAKECFRSSFETATPDVGYYPYLVVSLIRILISFKHPFEALSITNNVLKSMEDYKDLYFLKSMCEYELGQFNNCYNSLVKYTSLNKNLSKYPSFNFENDNDIPGMTFTINNLRTPHSIGLNSTLIINENNSFKDIEKTILDAWDFSDELYVIDSEENKEKILKYTNNYFSLDSPKEEIIEACTTIWLLTLKSPIPLPLEFKKALVLTLNQTSGDVLKISRNGDEFIRVK